MNREEAAEDLLLRARQCLLEDHDEKRFEIAVQSSRELELLYQAGVQFDARAGLLPGDEIRLSALVQRTLDRLDRDSLPEAQATERQRVVVRSAPRSLAVRYFAASVAFGLLLSVALASAWDYVEKRRALAHMPEPAPVAKLTALPAAKPATPAPLAPSLKPEPIPTPLSASASASALAPTLAARRAPAAPALTSNAQAARTGDSPSEGQLFARANELRRRGDSAGAIVVYERLCEQYPNSAEAEDAKILLGNLLLGQRSARAALQKFDDYGSGALTLEALWGKAQALRNLGSPGERAVLETLVSDYPNSPYAGAAQKRLQELSP